MTLHHESQLDETLSEALTIDGHQFYLYGDAAYMLRPWLQTAFDGLLTLQQESHNDSMKAPRASVEWGFKDVKQVCSFLDFPHKMKVREVPVGLLYKIGALVWNLRCCMYGSATSAFFKCAPPSVEDYLRSGGHVAGEDD